MKFILEKWWAIALIVLMFMVAFDAKAKATIVTETRCINGHEFVIAYRPDNSHAGAVSIVQVFKRSSSIHRAIPKTCAN